MKKYFILFLLLLITVNSAAMQVEFSSNTPVVGRYEKFEVVVAGDFPAVNKYDYGKIYIKGYFNSPAGSSASAEGFYMEDFSVSGDMDKFSSAGGSFRIRFTPDFPGKWKYRFKIFIDGKAEYTSAWASFKCEDRENAKGFIRVSPADPLFLEFRNKEPFFAKAVNMCWSTNNVLKDYGEWTDRFSENGGNLIRIWMANWSFGIEWDGALGNYGNRQKQAFLLDKVLDMCAEKDIYIMLCLVPHGEFSSKINPNWDSNPYNTINDGLLIAPEDFFTDKVARQAFKNRLRYITARWSYSTNIMAWEAFNEVDLTENYNTEKVKEWHRDILSFIKKHDRYNHLLTTSFSDPSKDPEIWKLKDIDFTQTHVYGIKDASKLYELSKIKLDQFSKPHIVGEYGIDYSDKLKDGGLDGDGIHIHNGIWAGTFSLSFGTPMPWWWDIYLYPRNLYRYYKPLSDFIAGIKWARSDFYELKQRHVFYKNVEGRRAGDVTVFPLQSWGRSEKNKFWVKDDGTVINKGYLGGYLFGSAHPEMQNNPMIIVRNMKPSRMKVKLVKVSSDNVFTVTLNGFRAYNVSVCAKDAPEKQYFKEWDVYQADIDTELVFDLPIGENEIELSNTGKDWILIGSITFEEVMSPKLAPVFVSGIQSDDSVYMWIKHRDYSWSNTDPDKINGAYIDIPDLDSARYIVTVYDTYSGGTIKTWEDIIDNQVLRVELPDFNRDLAVSVVRYKAGK